MISRDKKETKTTLPNKHDEIKLKDYNLKDDHIVDMKEKNTDNEPTNQNFKNDGYRNNVTEDKNEKGTNTDEERTEVQITISEYNENNYQNEDDQMDPKINVCPEETK